MKLSPHFQKLKTNYLFEEISKRKAKCSNEIINFGIGDVTKPLAAPIVEAMQKASLELGNEKTMRGYGPSEGYLFLREKMAHFDFQDKISPDEIFISNSSKVDFSNIQELFSLDSKIALFDPAYPVYVDSNVLAGRAYKNILYLPCKEENGFMPKLPLTPVDLIYICSPNNPTGLALSKVELEKWVKYAEDNGAIILYDSAYEAFITSEAPRSIYEIEGARKVAIEIKSFSKKAGFTSIPCSAIIIPKELEPLHSYWKRRINTKYNGTPYVIQKAAEAIYSEKGRKAITQQIQEYQLQTRTLKDGLESQGFQTFGGIDAPYVWCKVPGEMSSWDFFDFLLNKAGIVSVPGSGFGKSGEGYVRLSGFAPLNTIKKGIEALCVTK